jgi:hypothetical protein
LLAIALAIPCMAPFLDLLILRFGLKEVCGDFAVGGIFLFSLILIIGLDPWITKKYLFLFFYVVAKISQSLFSNVMVGDIFVSAVSLLLIYKIYDTCVKLSALQLMNYLKLLVVFSLVLIVLSSEMNFFINGNLLPILYQNLTIPLIFSLLLLIRIQKNYRQVNILKCLLLILLIYGLILYLRSNNSALHYQVQVKFFIMAPAIILFFYVLRVLKFVVQRKFKFFKVFIFISIFFVVSVFLFLSYRFILSKYSTVLTRTNSSSVRLAVNTIMLNRVNSEWFTMLFGFGIGSSAGYYDLSTILGRSVEARAHSGLMIIYYEHGLFGALLFILSLIFAAQEIKKKIKQNISDLNFQFGFKENLLGTIDSFLMLIASFCLWISLNLIIISSVPGPDPFWNGSISIYLLTWIITMRLYFSEKPFECIRMYKKP